MLCLSVSDVAVCTNRVIWSYSTHSVRVTLTVYYAYSVPGQQWATQKCIPEQLQAYQDTEMRLTGNPR